ncbi:MAG: hypothetical protein JWM88_59 [Verrucomicrobia bacterium]|nr:hypothetical protein [Verrucomicrobiota bacterium]
MLTPRDPAVDVLPRSLRRATALGLGGSAKAAIIYPASDARYRALAGQIAAAIGQQSGSEPECIADTALIPERSTPLPDSYRQRPLVALGSLNTNCVLQPLYADFLCSTDATYPGGDGFDLRTIVNPYGTGANLVLVGGGSLRGVERAAERLVAALAKTDASATLPWMLDVEIDPGLAAQLADWPYTSLADSAALQASRARGLMFITEPIRLIGAHTLMWSWTGDVRHAHVARDQLLALNERMENGYGDWHYLAERFMRAVPLLIAGGFLKDEEIERTDRLLMLTALHNQDEWWRMRLGAPPLGHRHQGKGTYEFLLVARYLRSQAKPTPALRALCDRWIAECCTFLDALAAARICDQDDESSLNNIATVFRYALGQERHAFFTSGNARCVAERCLALHDNHGSGAGQGGYGESQGMYLQQEATIQTAASAFYYGDGKLKWILHQLPNLAVPQRYSFLHFVPVFLQKFDTGPELAPVAPDPGGQVECLPVTDHQLAIGNQPPEHIEYSGHMVNAPETWQLPESIGVNRLPQSRGFDKIVLRGGYGPADAYLMIQGYQGGFRWQGHMQAANAIVRFFQSGHVFLVQNTSRHSYHDKNGLFISDGRNDTRMPPIAERIAVADFPDIGLTATRLSGYHHTTWTRHVFWSKSGEGCFVVIDRVVFEEDGAYSAACTWRTPGFAKLEGRRWRSDQGRHRFTLVAGASLPSTCDEEFDQGGCAPYVLRQRWAGTCRAGDETTFQNLFRVRTQSDPELIDLRQLTPRSAVVMRAAAPWAWCAVALAGDATWMPGHSAIAASAWVEAGVLTFAGATEVKLAGIACEIHSNIPVSLRFDLAQARLTVKKDSAESVGARIAITVENDTRGLTLADSLTLPFEPKLGAQFAKAISAWLTSLNPPEPAAAVPKNSVPDEGWLSAWTFDSGTRIPERVREVCVTADPMPVDVSPDQLLDPVMPDGYSREIWTQWPKAPHYDLSLVFPEPRAVTALNILGDCIDDPSLRTFNPLPPGIKVEVERAAGGRRSCPVNPAPDRRYKRYRDAENRLEARVASVNEKARSLHLRIPGPPDGRPFVLHRLEVLSDRLIAPELQHWIAADLDGDGRSEIITVNSVNELVALDDQGRELWRRTLAVPVTHVSAQPLDRQGPPVLCVGLLGGELHLFNADGTPRKILKLAEEFRGRKDCLMGWFNAIHCLAVWHRGADGRGALAVGGYGIMVFLDADGGIAGHSFSDGPWNFDILVTPPGKPGAGDLYVRCGWNHGIQYYEGTPGERPSGVRHSFGGFMQPMFRALRRVIPFLNGRSLAYEWVSVPGAPEGALFSATELGCGVLSAAKKDWLWKLEGGMSLNACSLGLIDGRPVALTAGADAFVTAVDLADGRVLRSWHAGGPVVGVAQESDGRLTVATRTDVLSLDQAWKPRGRIRRPVRRMLALAPGRFLICRDDHGLELLEHAEGPRE